MSGVKLTDIVEKMNLKNLTPEVDITEREVLVPDVNRPALQLAGFFDHFDLNRVQIIGKTRKELRFIRNFWNIKYHVLFSAMNFSRMKASSRSLRKMIFRYSVHVRRHPPLWEN